MNNGKQNRVQLLDALDDPLVWELTCSDGARATVNVSKDGDQRFLRIDYEFSGAGYVGIKRRLPITLPDNYSIGFKVAGEGLPNNLELKFLDETVDGLGHNVWWARWPHFTLPARMQPLRAKKRHVTYAWGPDRDPFDDVAALEFCLSASSGGSGHICLSELTLQPLPESQDIDAAAISVSATSGEETARALLDPLTDDIWHSTSDGRQELVFDLAGQRELGGLVIDWGTRDRLNNDTARKFSVQIPDGSGSGWRTVFASAANVYHETFVFLPELETAQLKLVLEESNRDRGYGIRSVQFKAIGFSKTANDFWSAVAKNEPGGSYPDYLDGNQTYWTVVSMPHGAHKALLSEHGTLEVDRLGFTIEPFIRVGSDFLSWAQAKLSQSLADGCLPIPTVKREYDDCELIITAVAGETKKGKRGEQPATFLRYRVRNTSADRLCGKLFATIRPFQVNPPWQFLNAPGGFTPIRSIVQNGLDITVNNDKVVVPCHDVAPFGATTLDGGDISAHLASGFFPVATEAHDVNGFASGAIMFVLDLQPGEDRDFYIAVTNRQGRNRVGDPKKAFSDGLSVWRRKLSRVKIELPVSASEISDTLKAQVAYIFANSNGVAFQPGARCYARTWIRDSALTSSALLEWGYGKEVADFIRWFAPFQFAIGKIPCCVDARGADAVPEHDSAGEFIYLVTEYFRYTGDRALADEMFPRVLKAVEYMEALRATRLTDEYSQPDKLHLRGLMPESISHEGYSDKPAHSYWDDLWALRGYKDAAYLAEALGKPEQARLAEQAAEFKSDLFASIRAAMAYHNIDFIPGAADRGDFDATSTTMALDPVCESDALVTELEATFERYWQFFTERRDGGKWDAYTPYEWRSVGAFVRLGHRDRAHALADWFMSHRRPAGFRHWAEVVFGNQSTPKFVGDAPHTWVGSDFLRSVRALLVFEREEGAHVRPVLVVGAGLRRAWLKEGFYLPSLRTRYGAISLSASSRGNRTTLTVAGKVDAQVKLSVPDGISTVLAGKRKLVPDCRGEVTLSLPAKLTLVSKPSS